MSVARRASFWEQGLWRGPWLIAAAAELLMASTGHGAEAGLNIGVKPGYPGATVPLPFIVQRATNAVAAQYEIQYDPNKLTVPAGISESTAGGFRVLSKEIAPGRKRVLIYSHDNARFRSNTFSATTPFVLAATEYSGSGPIYPTNATVALADASRVSPLALRAGAIFVQPAYRNIDGTVSFFLPSVLDERYLIQATTNFTTWDTISTNLASGEFMDLVDLDAPRYPHRFYRSAQFESKVNGTIQHIERLQAGSVQLRVAAFPGRTYQIEASTNLTSWEVVQTIVPSDQSATVIDPSASLFRQRFYRLVSRP